MTRLLVLLAAALLLLPAAAQSQVIHGVVVEDSTRVAIAGAAIELLGLNGRAVGSSLSDSTGAFLLRPLRSGNLVVRVTHPSYVANSPMTLTVRPDERIAVELRMGRAALALEPLIVTTRRDARLAGFYERLQQSSPFAQFLTRDEIRPRRAARVSDLLRDMRGIQIRPAQPGVQHIIMGRTISVGGGQNCMPTIYVDGIRVEQFPDGGVDTFVTAALLEGVEVYARAGDGPPDLPAIRWCGVVAFWTRPESYGNRLSALALLGTLAAIGITLLVAR